MNNHEHIFCNLHTLNEFKILVHKKRTFKISENCASQLIADLLISGLSLFFITKNLGSYAEKIVD